MCQFAVTAAGSNGRRDDLLRLLPRKQFQSNFRVADDSPSDWAILW
jgi:hypothetical protein